MMISGWKTKYTQILKEFKYDGGIPRGIIHTEGSHWTIQRRFSLKTLKDFGFGKQSLEVAINTEIDEVIKKFSRSQVCQIKLWGYKYLSFVTGGRLSSPIRF